MNLLVMYGYVLFILKRDPVYYENPLHLHNQNKKNKKKPLNHAKHESFPSYYYYTIWFYRLLFPFDVRMLETKHPNSNSKIKHMLLEFSIAETTKKLWCFVLDQRW